MSTESQQNVDFLIVTRFAFFILLDVDVGINKLQPDVYFVFNK
jgi:hypothetical protein